MLTDIQAQSYSAALLKLGVELSNQEFRPIEVAYFCNLYDLPTQFFDALRNLDCIDFDFKASIEKGEMQYKSTSILLSVQPEEVYEQIQALLQEESLLKEITTAVAEKPVLKFYGVSEKRQKQWMAFVEYAQKTLNKTEPRMVYFEEITYHTNWSSNTIKYILMELCYMDVLERVSAGQAYEYTIKNGFDNLPIVQVYERVAWRRSNHRDQFYEKENQEELMKQETSNSKVIDTTGFGLMEITATDGMQTVSETFDDTPYQRLGFWVGKEHKFFDSDEEAIEAAKQKLTDVTKSIVLVREVATIVLEPTVKYVSDEAK